jgi:hypothetical protein
MYWGRDHFIWKTRGVPNPVGEGIARHRCNQQAEFEQLKTTFRSPSNTVTSHVTRILMNNNLDPNTTAPWRRRIRWPTRPDSHRLSGQLAR